MGGGSRAVALALCSVLVLAAVACSDHTGPERAQVDSCDSSMPGAACYATQRDPGSEQIALATAIAHRHLEEHPAAEQTFDWGPGVLMLALTELHRVTGDPVLHAHYQAYLDHHIAVGYRVDRSDACPPALTALALLADADVTTGTDQVAYEQVVADVLAYLRDAPRTPEGGISHLGPDLTPPASIWVDSLFMFGLVLARHGEVTGDEWALGLLSEQLDVFAGQLQADGGLLAHADGWPLPNDDEVHWARGNGWALVALVEHLRVQARQGASDPQAERMLQDLVGAVLDTQDPSSGMWWTVMDRPGEAGNYQETSATALLAYGLARAHRYGLVGEQGRDAAQRAVEGIEGAIAWDEQGRPFVTGISEGTLPSTYDGYVQVPVHDDLSYGVGAVILALVETSGL